MSIALLLYAGTVFTSAFLLFLVQPLIAKGILPWFGGSAAVWITCMVFFQTILLAGYAYADGLSRLAPRIQALIHGVLLLASLAFLPITPDPSWKPTGDEEPALRILALLAATIGLPYFMLSTTGPLLQSWVARTLVSVHVYRLFSLSNLASLLALLGYPFLVEPLVTTQGQTLAWSGLYAGFAVLCGGAALFFARRAPLFLATARPQASASAASAHPIEAAAEGAAEAGAMAGTPLSCPPTLADHGLWIGLSALGAWLLLGITNHLTQNIAPIPLLWLFPLTLYLLTFILCFDSDRWYRRGLVLPAVAVLLVACAWGTQTFLVELNLKIAVPLYLAGLFLGCLFLHGELAQLRPGPRHLTRFYLMVSLGGALGGATVGLLASWLLPAHFELGAGFVLVALLAVRVLRAAPRRLRWGAWAVAALCCVFLGLQVRREYSHARLLTRNFYGTLQITERVEPPRNTLIRRLHHGAIVHGEQIQAAKERDTPTAYYGPHAGIGLDLGRPSAAPRRVGVVGLGIGTLAAYGRPGDLFRFYELNPQIVATANSEFTFLRDSPARIEISLGDGRLALERDPPQRFDVLVVDAFSGDAIPVHLLTREAVALYLRHLAPRGILAFHVTNRFLDLAPVVAQLAAAHGLQYIYIRHRPGNDYYEPSDWLLLAREAEVLAEPSIARAAHPVAARLGLSPWTDDFNNLFQSLK